MKKTFMLPGVDILRPDGSYTPYMPHPAYNNPERINNEGGGITGYMYLKYNDLELEKLMLHGRISACIVMRKHC